MKFMDSFGHYDLTGMLLKWDSLEVSDDYSLSFVSVSDANSGGAGIQLGGTEITLKKTGIDRMSPAILAFRLALDGTVTISFLYESFVLGSCKIEGGTAFIIEPNGTETDVNLEAVSSTSTFWEFKIVPELGGSFALYRNAILMKSVSSDFYNIGNRITGFQIKFENVTETVLSDLFLSETQHGIKAVGCYFPSSDVEVEMLPSAAVGHYTLVNNKPQDGGTYVTSGYGEKEIFGYSVSADNIFSIVAVALTALLGKDVGGEDAGIGVKGVEQVGGTDFTFAQIYPTSSVRFRQLIADTRPSTGGSWTPSEISSLSVGIKVDNDS